ncbi:transcription antitermination factor NusB [Pararhodonellum marinum]|uniref:transcription antitermination factor NusB n=1 Tax=Pararhodonellum marinum TaxID=2755358 RepID=UPI00188F2DBE|nr:transcription antitermination factor NusB [Pararhodonellum marinum]
MLNRRILRVKAFQNLYAYEQCKGSNLQLAKDFIQESFLPDLNTMEVQDKPQLKKDAQEAIALFLDNLNNKRLVSKTDHSPKIKKTALDALNKFHEANEKDLNFMSKNMIATAERIPQLYLYAIELLIAFSGHVESELLRKKKLNKSVTEGQIGEANLANNQVLQTIKNSPSYQNELIRQHVSLDELELEIREWYRDYIRPFELYQAYMQEDRPDLEKDQEILEQLLKKVIFKNEVILNFFEEKDLNWTENKSVVRSLASKVLKNAGESIGQSPFELPQIAINWDEDKEFFQNIFNFTIENDEANRSLIAAKTKNWDIDRIAGTDKIIMSMALTEMKHFPSIPVKVSINEYIDISKTYSTPKSKQFVNGLLDVLSKELTESGEIRKSGRGLLDNK